MNRVKRMEKKFPEMEEQQVIQSAQEGDSEAMTYLLEKYKAGHITADTALAYMKDTSIIDQLKRLVAVEEAKKLVAAKKK